MFTYLKYCLTLAMIGFSLGLIAQPDLRIQAGYSFLRHSQLPGFHLDHTVMFGQGAHRLALGLGLNYAEGNRNFNASNPGIFSIQFQDNLPIPPFSTFISEPKNELQVRTSTTFQLTGKLGYIYLPPSKPLRIEAGIYLSYINKSYVATVLDETTILRLIDNNLLTRNLVIPFHLRYLAIGPYLSADYTFWQGKSTSWGLGASYHLARNRHGWLDVGVSVTFGKE